MVTPLKDRLGREKVRKPEREKERRKEIPSFLDLKEEMNLLGKPSIGRSRVTIIGPNSTTEIDGDT